MSEIALDSFFSGVIWKEKKILGDKTYLRKVKKAGSWNLIKCEDKKIILLAD